MRFRVEEDFWSLFPTARIGTVVVRGVDNRRAAADGRALLDEAARDAVRHLGDGELPAHPAIAPWRAAYRAFGVRPADYRSSIEGLLRSARAGGVRSVNPLVDLYNVVSLRFELSCGGEDLRAIVGDIRLTRATGDEAFVPLGGSEPQPPKPGEVIYRDDLGVICRCWNWREADRTKLTETTTDAFLCLEAIPPIPESQLRDACETLAGLVRDHLGGNTTVALLDRGRPDVDLDL